MDEKTRSLLINWADTYNDPQYFQEDPIAFPTRFAEMMKEGVRSLKDVEISALFAAHFAWGRRAMIVRDCTRLFDEMDWRPYDYVMKGNWRNDNASIHRTVKWSEVAGICARLKSIYESRSSIESLTIEEIRTKIFGQKEDSSAPNKKINMMRRWMVRNDGKVDLQEAERFENRYRNYKQFQGNLPRRPLQRRLRPFRIWSNESEQITKSELICLNYM